MTYGIPTLSVASPWYVGLVAVLALALAAAMLVQCFLYKELRRRRAVKTELRDQLVFQQAMLENIPQAICVRDAQARLMFCNAAFEELFAVSRNAMEGKTVIEDGLGYVDTTLKLRVHERYVGLLADHVAINEEADIVVHGQTRHIVHWAAPISIKPGTSPRALVAGIIDVTERHHLIEQIEAALGKAEKANRAKSNFLATMSHEIRTPMNAVMGMLELVMREGSLNGKDSETIEVARDSAESLLGLIDDILDMSKIEAGGLEIILAPARLRPILEDVAKMFGGLARKRGLAIALEIDPEIGEWHAVDAIRFRQIVNNLVSNAIKYTDVGRVNLRLRHSRRVGDVESIVLEVQDTGIGIAPKDVSNLFQPFFQAESAGPRAVGGTGLGLPIVQRLCLKMGGKIEVSSERGRGTCVRVSFDFAASAPPAAAHLPSLADPASVRPWRRGSCKVLAVDDHPANRLLLQRQLDHLGLDCDLAEDGNTAWELWREGGYDLVITDCSMPVMDGYALTAAIRDMERAGGLPRCPVLGCTAHVQEAERRHALEVGMDECLMKPFSLDALAAALHRHLRDEPRQPLPAGSAGPSSQASANAPHRPPFDLLALRGLSDGDARVEARFLDALLRTNLSDMREIVMHVASGDYVAAASMAHKIKGAARMVRAERVMQACESLEVACRAEDATAATVGVAQLATDVDELNRSIESQQRIGVPLPTGPRAGDTAATSGATPQRGPGLATPLE